LTKHLEKKRAFRPDLIQFIMEHSRFLNKEENKWMLSVIQVVRKTSMFFQPQIRTKIMNEGWASFWHETLFLQDDRINGHEVDFARVNAGVTAMPRVGLNPYALGMKLFYFIEEAADKGRYSQQFLGLLDAEQRRRFDLGTGTGQDYIFRVRENMNDFLFVNTFIEQDFVDRNKLFVADKVLDEKRMVWQWYVKSRNAEDYKTMVKDSLYHPPHITIDPAQTDEGNLWLDHTFEDKPLVREFINNTMLGLEFLWGGKVTLETTEVKSIKKPDQQPSLPGMGTTGDEEETGVQVEWQRVRYTMKDRKISKGLV
jgi:stage V sporulation protein R